MKKSIDEGSRFKKGDVVQIKGFDELYKIVYFASKKVAVVKDIIGTEPCFNIDVDKLLV
jgi:hypothetical protein